MPHAFLPPSSAGQWTACPGSRLLQQQHPDETSGPAAKEGTIAHAYAANWLIDNKEPEMPGDMAKAISVYVKDVFLVPGERQIEQTVTIPAVHPHCWGTPDAVVRNGNRVWIWDLKYGYGIVEVFMNWQLLCYACGVSEPGDEIHLRIVQPRVWHKQGPVREWVITYEGLQFYGEHLRAAASAAMGDDPQTVPGLHCRYCSARHSCKSARRVCLDGADYAGETTTEELSDKAIGREIETLRWAQDLIGYRLTGLEADAFDRLRAGRRCEGIEVSQSKGRMEWSHDEAEIIAMAEMLSVDIKKPPELITPVKAIKAGVPAEIVNQYATRRAGHQRLITNGDVKAKKVFGNGD